jgi:hypothetical protein
VESVLWLRTAHDQPETDNGTDFSAHQQCVYRIRNDHWCVCHSFLSVFSFLSFLFSIAETPTLAPIIDVRVFKLTLDRVIFNIFFRSPAALVDQELNNDAKALQDLQTTVNGHIQERLRTRYTGHNIATDAVLVPIEPAAAPWQNATSVVTVALTVRIENDQSTVAQHEFHLFVTEALSEVALLQALVDLGYLPFTRAYGIHVGDVDFTNLYDPTTDITTSSQADQPMGGEDDDTTTAPRDSSEWKWWEFWKKEFWLTIQWGEWTDPDFYSFVAVMGGLTLFMTLCVLVRCCRRRRRVYKLERDVLAAAKLTFDDGESAGLYATNDLARVATGATSEDFNVDERGDEEEGCAASVHSQVYSYAADEEDSRDITSFSVDPGMSMSALDFSITTFANPPEPPARATLPHEESEDEESSVGSRTSTIISDHPVNLENGQAKGTVVCYDIDNDSLSTTSDSMIGSMLDFVRAAWQKPKSRTPQSNKLSNQHIPKVPVARNGPAQSSVMAVVASLEAAAKSTRPKPPSPRKINVLSVVEEIERENQEHIDSESQHDKASSRTDTEESSSKKSQLVSNSVVSDSLNQPAAGSTSKASRQSVSNSVVSDSLNQSSSDTPSRKSRQTVGSSVVSDSFNQPSADTASKQSRQSVISSSVSESLKPEADSTSKKSHLSVSSSVVTESLKPAADTASKKSGQSVSIVNETLKPVDYSFQTATSNATKSGVSSYLMKPATPSKNMKTPIVPPVKPEKKPPPSRILTLESLEKEMMPPDTVLVVPATTAPTAVSHCPDDQTNQPSIGSSKKSVLAVAAAFEKMKNDAVSSPDFASKRTKTSGVMAAIASFEQKSTTKGAVTPTPSTNDFASKFRELASKKALPTQQRVEKETVSPPTVETNKPKETMKILSLRSPSPASSHGTSSTSPASQDASTKSPVSILKPSASKRSGGSVMDTIKAFESKPRPVQLKQSVSFDDSLPSLSRMNQSPEPTSSNNRPSRDLSSPVRLTNIMDDTETDCTKPTLGSGVLSSGSGCISPTERNTASFVLRTNIDKEDAKRGSVVSPSPEKKAGVPFLRSRSTQKERSKSDVSPFILRSWSDSKPSKEYYGSPAFTGTSARKSKATKMVLSDDSEFIESTPVTLPNTPLSPIEYQESETSDIKSICSKECFGVSPLR